MPLLLSSLQITSAQISFFGGSGQGGWFDTSSHTPKHVCTYTHPLPLFSCSHIYTSLESMNREPDKKKPHRHVRIETRPVPAAGKLLQDARWVHRRDVSTGISCCVSVKFCAQMLSRCQRANPARSFKG